MRALVTGASGFVGRYLCAHLERTGDEVAVVDTIAAEAADAVDITDADAVRGAVERAAPEVVYHLAALSHVGESWKQGERLTQVNVVGTENVVNACRSVAVHRIVVVGSAEQYGATSRHDPPVREDAPMRPVTPYGQSKLAAETAALEAFHHHGLPVVCVRAFNHTGPGQPPQFLVPGIATRIAAAERLGLDQVTIGNGTPVRDFSDVRDVVHAYRLLAERGEPGETYNVASGVGMRIEDLARRLLRLSSRPLELITDHPELTRPVDASILVGDPAKLAGATGWTPEFSLDRTLADVLDWARN
jgi:GDP-4-dehydro-6-deoxy-D-mannose reductase